jgi:c(7)-type cytochrome triheme protein
MKLQNKGSSRIDPRVTTHGQRALFQLSACACGLLVVVFTLSASTRREAPNEQQMQVPENADYSKFQHSTAYHARLPCLLCHRRETNSARPSIPGGSNHLPCAGCHVKQFADSTNAICTICHSNAQSGALKPFPQLSSFNMRFDHARHTTMGGVGCSTCHRPSRGGVAMTIPAGFNAHVTCYQCHGPEAKSGERQISSCGVCHELGRRVRTPEMASAFRVGFSHAKHNKNEGLNCDECHRLRTGVVQRFQVSAPQPLNHHASPNAFSCMSCHNGKKAFGGDDFGACKRCHSKDTWHF